VGEPAAGVDISYYNRHRHHRSQLSVATAPTSGIFAMDRLAAPAKRRPSILIGAGDEMLPEITRRRPSVEPSAPPNKPIVPRWQVACLDHDACQRDKAQFGVAAVTAAATNTIAALLMTTACVKASKEADRLPPDERQCRLIPGDWSSGRDRGIGVQAHREGDGHARDEGEYRD
jgi:hypothetical protein